jgi:hypothetical protein
VSKHRLITSVWFQPSLSRATRIDKSVWLRELEAYCGSRHRV